MAEGIVVLLSGGLDSVVLAHRAAKMGALRGCLFVNYGQPVWDKERPASRYWAEHLGAPWRESTVTMNTRAMVGNGHKGPRVVHARNLVLAALGMNYAHEIDAQWVWLGATKDDHEEYTDCRPDWFLHLNQAQGAALPHKPADPHPLIDAPFTYCRAPQILRYAEEYGIDLDRVWSCYYADRNGNQCGRCDSCRRATPEQ